MIRPRLLTDDPKDVVTLYLKPDDVDPQELRARSFALGAFFVSVRGVHENFAAILDESSGGSHDAWRG